MGLMSIRFEDAEVDMRVRDNAGYRDGTVHSISGSRSGRGKTMVRSLKVQWADGTFQDFHDGLPKGMILVALI